MFAGKLLYNLSYDLLIMIDMGHFGKNAVRISWLAIVYPSLILNYLGQGAMLIKDPTLVDDPFFHQVPYPVLLLDYTSL